MIARWAVGIGLVAAIGCGIQGPPVPPETIGVNPRFQREKAREAKEHAAKEQAAKDRATATDASFDSLHEHPAEEMPRDITPLDGSVQPSARPGGDVQLKPR